MAFQYPVEIPGVSNQFFRKPRSTPCAAIVARSSDRFDFQDLMEDKIKLLKMPEDLLTRSVNVGFSGGEKAQRYPADGGAGTELCILDESDSGLDIDALKIVSDGVNSLRDGKRFYYRHPLSAHSRLYRRITSTCCTRGESSNPAILLWSNNWRSKAMAGLLNSSNALQQWHHLFESQRAASLQAHQHLQQLLRLGLPT